MPYSRENPSPLYLECVERARQHHATSKTYSGKFLRPHAPFIRDMMDRLDCRSILDYGCGKGKQYEWVSHGEDASIPLGMTIPQFWGVSFLGPRSLRLFDPGVLEFNEYPKKSYDMVICTHVLGSVPLRDLEWFIPELLRLTNKALYIAEKIGPVGKTVFTNPQEMPWNLSHEDWFQLLHGCWIKGSKEIWLSTRTATPRGVETVRVQVQ